MGWEDLLGYMFSSLFTQNKVAKGQLFTTVIEKVKLNSEIDIKNRTYYYFDNIMRAWDIDIDTDFSDIIVDKKYIKKKTKIF